MVPLESSCWAATRSAAGAAGKRVRHQLPNAVGIGIGTKGGAELLGETEGVTATEALPEGDGVALGAGVATGVDEGVTAGVTGSAA